MHYHLRDEQAIALWTLFLCAVLLLYYKRSELQEHLDHMHYINDVLVLDSNELNEVKTLLKNAACRSRFSSGLK